MSAEKRALRLITEGNRAEEQNRMRDACELHAAAVDAEPSLASAHLNLGIARQARGKPVWLMNRYESEWRWGVAGEACPWYPTMRIFRQRRRGDWDGVAAEIPGALRAE